jgi:hypothetical protein
VDNAQGTLQFKLIFAQIADIFAQTAKSAYQTEKCIFAGDFWRFLDIRW